MIRGVSTDVVSAVLNKLPSGIRNAVQTVTTELSSAVMLTVRKVFPKATLINDRFHVRKPMSEAIDPMRIRLRRQVLEEENKALKEHRDRRKAAKNRKESEAMGHREPYRRFWQEADTFCPSTNPNGTDSKGAGRKCFSSNFQNWSKHTGWV